MRRSAGMPMTGLLAIQRDTLSLGPNVRALSSIFYGAGPEIGLTVAIRPHLHGVRLDPVRACARAAQARNRPVQRFAGPSPAGICCRARRPCMDVLASKIINAPRPRMTRALDNELELFLATHPAVRFFDAFVNDLNTVERGK